MTKYRLILHLIFSTITFLVGFYAGASDGNNRCRLKHYIIQNNTLEDYVIWIASDTVYNKTDKDKVHDHFIKRIGDFNLISLLNEDFVDVELLKADILTFQALLPPGDRLNIYVVQYDDAEFKVAPFESRFVILPLTALKNDYNINLNPRFLFTGAGIIISNNNIRELNYKSGLLCGGNNEF